MATFKVGQRVRIDAPDSRYHGLTGTIWQIGLFPWGHFSLTRGVSPMETGHCVDVDGIGRKHWDGISLIGFPAYKLRPLTDPKADEFIETVKRWGPLHEEPKAPVRETI